MSFSSFIGGLDIMAQGVYLCTEVIGDFQIMVLDRLYIFQDFQFGLLEFEQEARMVEEALRHISRDDVRRSQHVLELSEVLGIDNHFARPAGNGAGVIFFLQNLLGFLAIVIADPGIFL